MKVQIVYPGMYDSNVLQTADHWVSEYVKQALNKMGHAISTGAPDIQWEFVGMRQRRRHKWIAPFRAGWIYSQPHRYVKIHLKRLTDRHHQIYAISTIHANRLRKEGATAAKPLLPAAGQQYHKSMRYDLDLVYLGTYRPHRLAPIAEVLNKYKVGVCGVNWEQIKGVEYIDEFWSNDDLGTLFNRAPLSFYAMDESHIDVGLIPIRILDTIASSDNLCIVQYNPGLKEVFGNTLPPTFSDTKELEAKIDYFLRHEKERKELQKALREHLSKYTYQDLCSIVIQDAQEKMYK